jgi:hypothetical protein
VPSMMTADHVHGDPNSALADEDSDEDYFKSNLERMVKLMSNEVLSDLQIFSTGMTKRLDQY